jgi:hypothetical protein
MFWYGPAAASAVPYGYTEDCGSLENSDRILQAEILRVGSFRDIQSSHADDYFDVTSRI